MPTIKFKCFECQKRHNDLDESDGRYIYEWDDVGAAVTHAHQYEHYVIAYVEPEWDED